MTYKTCCVPQCKSTTIKSPDKIFITVPNNLEIRRRWLKLAERSLDSVSDKTVIFFCEDHFDLEKDMENYMQFKMGFSKYAKMMSGVIPTKFHCQQTYEIKSCSSFDENNENIQPNAYVKQETQSVNVDSTRSCDKSVSTTHITFDSKATQSNIQTCEKATGPNYNKKLTKTTQYSYRKPFRSKASQTSIQTIETGVSPKRLLKSTCMKNSTFSIEKCSGQMPSRYGSTDKYSVAYVTVPNIDVGKKLAHGLVKNKLAACVNIVPQITSIYEWKDEINEDSESLLMIKTRTSLVDKLTEFVRSNHPYEVCEVISLPIQNGNPPYLKWIGEVVPEGQCGTGCRN